MRRGEGYGSTRWAGAAQGPARAAVVAAVLGIVAIRAAFHRADAADKVAAQPSAIPVVTATAAKEDVPIFL